MGMFAPIPLPGIDNPQFKDVMDYFQQLKEMKIKAPLWEAQTQEAQANALKSKMFANLINSAFGGAPIDNNQGVGNYQMTGDERARAASMQPGDSMVVGQGVGETGGTSSSPNRAKQMLYAL